MGIRQPTKFDPSSTSIGITAAFDAALVDAESDPPTPFDGLIFGVARMSENSPHGGEMHPHGDEVLYLISGAVRVVFEAPDFDDVDMHPGDGLVVPRGVWHRVDILKPSEIMYATAGPTSEYRPVGYVSG